MSIEDYFGSWARLLDLKEADRILRLLAASGKSICPMPKDIFKAFRLCSYQDLRLCILGQDPYPQKGVATGLAFANHQNTDQKSLSPSLEILMESVIDYTVPHNPLNFDITLEKWAKQGALLLNSALSCEAGKPGIHTLLWRPFIRTFLKRLSTTRNGVIYVLMGKQAQSFKGYIDDKFNYIVETPHPAGLARTHKKLPSQLWKDINYTLVRQNGYGIEWYEETKI